MLFTNVIRFCHVEVTHCCPRKNVIEACLSTYMLHFDANETLQSQFQKRLRLGDIQRLRIPPLHMDGGTNVLVRFRYPIAADGGHGWGGLVRGEGLLVHFPLYPNPLVPKRKLASYLDTYKAENAFD